MKSFFGAGRLYILARLIRWHSQSCTTCAAASAKGDTMNYEDFCPKGLKLVKAVEKVMRSAPSG